jgi:hypothetical protein
MVLVRSKIQQDERERRDTAAFDSSQALSITVFRKPAGKRGQ